MNIAIIGSNGFIGKHLTQTLQKETKNKIFLFGKSPQSFFGDLLPYTQLNLLNSEQVNLCFKEIDLIYYLASESIPSSSWEKPSSEIELNLLPFVKFMETITQLEVKKIVFVSSAGTIYGPTSEKVTEDSVKNPFSPYGITKLTMEFYLNYFKIKSNLNYDIYRVSNVYGAGQDTSKGLGIINTFLEKILQQGRIQIFGDGEITRNYVYIQDVAELLNLSVISDLSTSNIYNLASDYTLKINDLVKMMKQIVEEDFEVVYKDNRNSDNSAILLDNSKIKAALPTYQLTAIKEGIRKTYVYIKAQFTKTN
jgi:UDP-glucose 4-epimerase